MQEVEAVHSEADIFPVGGHGHNWLGVVPGHVMVEVACDIDTWGVSERLWEVPSLCPLRRLSLSYFMPPGCHLLIILIGPLLPEGGLGPMENIGTMMNAAGLMEHSSCSVCHAAF